MYRSGDKTAHNNLYVGTAQQIDDSDGFQLFAALSQ